jgi:hypothetical protein
LAKKQLYKITKAQALKVLETVDAGLVNGIGEPKPGHMCVEAAVAYSLGYQFNDQPKCVTESLISTKIYMNDSKVWYGKNWGQSDDPKVAKIRSHALRRIAIAQLGSRGIISNKQWELALLDYYKSKIPLSSKEKKKKADFIKRVEGILSKVKSGQKVNEYKIHYSDRFTEMEDEIQDRLFDTDVFGVLDVKTIAKAKQVIEDLVQILIKLKSPGTKFLFLTEPAKKHSRKKAK